MPADHCAQVVRGMDLPTCRWTYCVNPEQSNPLVGLVAAEPELALDPTRDIATAATVCVAGLGAATHSVEYDLVDTTCDPPRRILAPVLFFTVADIALGRQSLFVRIMGALMAAAADTPDNESGNDVPLA